MDLLAPSRAVSGNSAATGASNGRRTGHRSSGARSEGAHIRFEDITSEEPPAMLDHGAAEIVLLDRHGVIVAANPAWRVGVVALGLKLTNAGVGARYAAVAKVIVPATDEILFANGLDELFSGGVSEFEATFTQETPAGKSRRQVRISPLQIGQAGYFLAIHEDLSQRVKVLAALHETSEQLLHAQEKERQRIAIELHDSMGQHLAGLMLGLAQLRRKIGQDPAAAQADVNEMVKLTQHAAKEMRVLSYLMNAAGGKREGLEASVRRLVEGFARRTGLRASLATRGPVDAIDAVTEHAMFRVTQEALTNVYRHARAKKVSVRLDSQPGTLTVRISDDGHGVRLARGSDLGEAPLGVGIMGMRVRVEQLGGMLEIAGGGGGTVVTAMVPFSPAP